MLYSPEVDEYTQGNDESEHRCGEADVVDDAGDVVVDGVRLKINTKHFLYANGFWINLTKPGHSASEN